MAEGNPPPFPNGSPALTDFLKHSLNRCDIGKLMPARSPYDRSQSLITPSDWRKRPPAAKLQTHPFLKRLTKENENKACTQLLRFMGMHSVPTLSLLFSDSSDEMDKVKASLLQKTMRIMKTAKGRGNVAIGEWH